MIVRDEPGAGGTVLLGVPVLGGESDGVIEACLSPFAPETSAKIFLRVGPPNLLGPRPQTPIFSALTPDMWVGGEGLQSTPDTTSPVSVQASVTPLG